MSGKSSCNFEMWILHLQGRCCLLCNSLCSSQEINGMLGADRLQQCFNCIHTGHTFLKSLMCPSGSEQKSHAIRQIQVTLLKNRSECRIFLRFHEHLVIRRHDMALPLGTKQVFDAHDGVYPRKRIDGNAKEEDAVHKEKI